MFAASRVDEPAERSPKGDHEPSRRCRKPPHPLSASCYGRGARRRTERKAHADFVPAPPTPARGTDWRRSRTQSRAPARRDRHQNENRLTIAGAHREVPRLAAWTQRRSQVTRLYLGAQGDRSSSHRELRLDARKRLLGERRSARLSDAP